MANNDQVSQLEEMIENLHSTSKSELYSEANVAGKGIGCIASKEIKKGILVLRESPQLLLPEQDSPTFQGAVQHAEDIIKVFKGMSQEDQESYLKLHNKFDDDRTTWSERLKREFEGKMLVISELTGSRMSKEKALEVWGIHQTNGFHNGVCIKMSRFNHSCRPNACVAFEDQFNLVVRALEPMEHRLIFEAHKSLLDINPMTVRDIAAFFSILAAFGSSLPGEAAYLVMVCRP